MSNRTPDPLPRWAARLDGRHLDVYLRLAPSVRRRYDAVGKLSHAAAADALAGLVEAMDGDARDDAPPPASPGEVAT